MTILNPLIQRILLKDNRTTEHLSNFYINVAEDGSGYNIFRLSGRFLVRKGMHSVPVLAVGGGASGGRGHKYNGGGGGGGSGYVEVRDVAVTPFDVIAVSVGSGGSGGSAAAGQPSQFGSYVHSNGGQAAENASGAGSSGGGGGARSNDELCGEGGADSTSGGSTNYSGGTGQGAFLPRLQTIRLVTFTAGRGGNRS